MSDLAGKTLFISGGSRGVGLEIAVRAARDGANVALMARTGEPHPKLDGTVFSAAAAIEDAGGTALPIVGDVRDSDSVKAAVEATAERFGGIDVCVNNASALDLSSPDELQLKRFRLMNEIQVCGTYAVTRACVEYLKRSGNPHVLTLSPPVELEAHWLAPQVGYTMAKYGMTLCALGFAEAYREHGIASNTLWPRTLVATAAVQYVLGGDEAMRRSRKPAIYSDAAYSILTRPSRECTANTFLCEDVLREEGVTNFADYACVPGVEPAIDLYVNHV